MSIRSLSIRTLAAGFTVAAILLSLTVAFVIALAFPAPPPARVTLAEARDAIARVREFIVRHGDTRFEPIGQFDDQRPISNRAGWKDEETFFFATDVWKNEVHRGSDAIRAAKHLDDAGFLIRGDGRNLTKRLAAKVRGKPRVYAVSGAILGAGSD